jgi:hypothetical protein
MTFDRVSSALRSSGSAWAMIVAGTLVAAPAWADGCRASSGPTTVPLVELFTSEGCNSCPPADRWLSANFPAGAPTATAVALAFHVDYWDRLGWTDRFAAPEWTARQHAAARANRSSFVFTPQVLVQGKDFPEWRGRGGAAGLAATAAGPARARIALVAEARADAIAIKATAHVPGAGDRKGSALYVALADNGLVSDVKAGENAGVRLRHDHVVRALRGGFAVDGNGDVAADVALAWPSEAGQAPTVVAFVQNLETGAVLQALSLPVSAGGCARPR